MKEDRFSPKRMIRMLGILISVAIYSVFLAIICKFTIDRVLVLAFKCFISAIADCSD